MIITLSRIQFALTILYHFIFVPLSIGLILAVAIFETKHFKTKEDAYRRLADYFGNIFVVIYAIGIVTGITMTIQFGTNWAEYSSFMGDVFGVPLALEALIAFFLESTFTGIYIFRRNKMSRRFRLVTVWTIFIGTCISALWIITANGFMQNPVGYEMALDNSHVIIKDFVQVVLNPYAWYIFFHSNGSAVVLGGFAIMSISSYKLLSSKVSGEDKDVFKYASKIGALIAFFGSLLTMIIGSDFMGLVNEVQPHKFASITGQDNPIVSQANATLVHISFMVMVMLGTFFLLISLYVYFFNKKYLGSKTLQKILMFSFILPYIAIMAGWIVSEVGRQPWTVTGLLYTKDSVSTNVSQAEVWFSLISTTLLYSFLIVVIGYFISKQVKNSLDSVSYEYSEDKVGELDES